jgi:hypothetical protein
MSPLRMLISDGVPRVGEPTVMPDGVMGAAPA